MLFEYDNEKVQKILSNFDLLQRKVGSDITKIVKKRLNQLEAADNFNLYLTKIPLENPHPLKCNFENCYGISITANLRLVVEPLCTRKDLESLKECKYINIKGVLDYHGEKNEWIIP